MNSPRTPEEGNDGGRGSVLSLRRNHRIKTPEVQVLDAAGHPLGTMRTLDAINRALEERLDLVEIGPDANPPICRMMDFPKYVAAQTKPRPPG